MRASAAGAFEPDLFGAPFLDGFGRKHHRLTVGTAHGGEPFGSGPVAPTFFAGALTTRRGWKQQTGLCHFSQQSGDRLRIAGQRKFGGIADNAEDLGEYLQTVCCEMYFEAFIVNSHELFDQLF